LSVGQRLVDQVGRGAAGGYRLLGEFERDDGVNEALLSAVVDVAL
jgi:hypothetical protein